MFDRVGVAFGSGVLAVILGSILWFSFAQLAPNIILPFRYVLYFSGVMALLGFLFGEDPMAELLGGLIEAIFDRKP